MDHWLRSFAALIALTLCAQITPSQGQPFTAQQGAPASQSLGAAPAFQPAPQQPTLQMSQVNVPLAEFLQYEKFLMDQTTIFADLTKQQLEFLKQQAIKNAEQVATITSFLKQETKEFKTFVETSVAAIVVVASIIAAVMAFFGIRRWKDLISEQKIIAENLMAEQRRTIQQILDNHNASMRELIDGHDQAIAKSLSEHGGAVAKVMEESDRNQQKWFKQMATDMSEEQFNAAISKTRILWSDETHEKWNNWLIKLIRSSGAELDAVKRIDAAERLNSGEQYGIIISDDMDLFDDFPAMAARKIINTGEEGLKKYKDVAEQHGVDAVVDTDAKLLRAMLLG